MFSLNLRKQISLILITSSIAMLLSILLSPLFFVFLELAQARTINFIMLAFINLVMAWRFGLKPLSAVFIGYAYSLISLFLSNSSGMSVLLQNSFIKFIIVILISPWLSALSGLSGAIVGRILSNKSKVS